MNILDEFANEGLLERVISQGSVQSGELPKVNPDVDQNVSSKISDKPDNKDGDQDEPTVKADEAYQDPIVDMALKSMEATEAIIAHIIKDKNNRYSEDKKTKINELYKSCQTLKAGLEEIANMEDYQSKATQK